MNYKTYLEKVDFDNKNTEEKIAVNWYSVKNNMPQVGIFSDDTDAMSIVNGTLSVNIFGIICAVIYTDVDELKDNISRVKKTYDKDGIVTYEFKYAAKGIELLSYSVTFENGLVTKASYNNYDSYNKMTRIETNT